MSVYVLTFALGYLLGRVRPLDRLDNAAWWRGISSIPRPSRFPVVWGYTWLALHPVKAFRVSRRTKGGPAQRPVHLRHRSGSSAGDVCPFHDRGLPLSLPPEVRCTCPSAEPETGR